MTSRTASILVTDLVGSTELRVRLGEEQAEDFRRAHDRLLADAVSRHNGVLVKGLGDGIIASFACAADALAAAVAVQQVAQLLDDLAGKEVLLRVGLSAGDVTMENGDCFGTPVVEACRLCAQAVAGGVLSAEIVLALARGRGGHRFEPVGPLVLKGMPEPVNACRVIVPQLSEQAGAIADDAPDYVADERFTNPAPGRKPTRTASGGSIVVNSRPSSSAVSARSSVSTATVP